MIFNQGDIVEFNLSPSRGHEPAGRRPALVVSSLTFNTSTSMTLVCPITSTMNGFPLHLELPGGLEVSGCVACEQVRAYDLQAREAIRLGSVPREFLRNVIECVTSFY